jgi:hypothetical protein
VVPRLGVAQLGLDARSLADRDQRAPAERVNRQGKQTIGTSLRGTVRLLRTVWRRSA